MQCICTCNDSVGIKDKAIEFNSFRKEKDSCKTSVSKLACALSFEELKEDINYAHGNLIG